MANEIKFEGKERRIAKIEKCLEEYGFASLEEMRDYVASKGIDAGIYARYGYCIKKRCKISC